jgi:hypothetical protein
MKNMESEGPRGAERLAIIRQAIALLQHDAPWIYGFHPKSYTLGHVWLHNRKPTDVGNNILKYQRIDVAERQRLRQEWNRPVLWPLARRAAAGGVLCRRRSAIAAASAGRALMRAVRPRRPAGFAAAA